MPINYKLIMLKSCIERPDRQTSLRPYARTLLLMPEASLAGVPVLKLFAWHYRTIGTRATKMLSICTAWPLAVRTQGTSTGCSMGISSSWNRQTTI
jgi:hypothetical protein